MLQHKVHVSGIKQSAYVVAVDDVVPFIIGMYCLPAGEKSLHIRNDSHVLQYFWAFLLKLTISKLDIG